MSGHPPVVSPVFGRHPLRRTVPRGRRKSLSHPRPGSPRLHSEHSHIVADIIGTTTFLSAFAAAFAACRFPPRTGPRLYSARGCQRESCSALPAPYMRSR